MPAGVPSPDGRGRGSAVLHRTEWLACAAKQSPQFYPAIEYPKWELCKRATVRRGSLWASGDEICPVADSYSRSLWTNRTSHTQSSYFGLNKSTLGALSSDTTSAC